jgi:hypothetical protein
MKFIATVIAMMTRLVSGLHAAVWQWSVPDGDARASLWIPEECASVRGVVLAKFIERAAAARLPCNRGTAATACRSPDRVADRPLASGLTAKGARRAACSLPWRHIPSILVLRRGNGEPVQPGFRPEADGITACASGLPSMF